MLNMRYLDEALPMQRQDELLKRNELKRLIEDARREVPVVKAARPSRRSRGFVFGLPRFGLPWS